MDIKRTFCVNSKICPDIPPAAPCVPCHGLRALVALFILSAMAPVSAQEEGWQELKQTHFLVYYVSDREFAERVGRSAEECYERIARDLGFTRHDNFWLWERRAKLYVYRTRADFTRATGSPQWAAGKADYGARTIATYEGSGTFIDSVLPHELTHLIFMDFIGPARSLPLWLHEGVAQWEDPLQRETALRLARRLAAGKRLTPLRVLMQVRIEAVGSTAQALAFYAQSASLVGFLIDRYGPSRFRTFCGQLRDGKAVDDALRFTYPSVLTSMESLETEWHRYLEESQ